MSILGMPDARRSDSTGQRCAQLQEMIWHYFPRYLFARAIDVTMPAVMSDSDDITTSMMRDDACKGGGSFISPRASWPDRMRYLLSMARQGDTRRRCYYLTPLLGYVRAAILDDRARLRAMSLGRDGIGDAA